MSDKDSVKEWSEYALLIYELNRIVESGGDAATIKRVRDALDAQVGSRIYVPRVATKTRKLVDFAIRSMGSGATRLEVISKIQQISGLGRSQAVKKFNKALSVKDHRARGVVVDQMDLLL